MMNRRRQGYRSNIGGLAGAAAAVGNYWYCPVLVQAERATVASTRLGASVAAIAIAPGRKTD